MRRLAVLALVLAPSLPRPAGACSREGPDGGTHRPDPRESSDLTPPGAITATFHVVIEHDETESSGCFTSCGPRDDSSIRLQLTATDDRTLPEDLGYQLVIRGGTLPDGLQLPYEPVRAKYSGDLELPIKRGARDFDFDLEVRAIDLNGNIGPATVIVVSDRT